MRPWLAGKRASQLIEGYSDKKDDGEARTEQQHKNKHKQEEADTEEPQCTLALLQHCP